MSFLNKNEPNLHAHAVPMEHGVNEQRLGVNANSMMHPKKSGLVARMKNKMRMMKNKLFNKKNAMKSGTTAGQTGQNWNNGQTGQTGQNWNNGQTGQTGQNWNNGQTPSGSTGGMYHTMNNSGGNSGTYQTGV